VIHELRRGAIHKAYAEEVYPLLEAGSVSLLISDGPYRMKSAPAAWDKFKSWEHFVDWYRPHIEAWGRVCAPSATVYLWGSDESEGYLRQPMREAGWTRIAQVLWDKEFSPATIGWAQCGTWPEATETCGVYVRGDARIQLPGPMMNIWRQAEAGYRDERLYAAEKVRHKIANRNDNRQALHPCQKPLAFYERMIRASSRPGDLVLEPYGGTCRAAVAIERLPAAEARRYICVEPDEDGRDYLAAVLRSLRFDPGEEKGKQPSLFGDA
jgi:DNA modification methylase